MEHYSVKSEFRLHYYVRFSRPCQVRPPPTQTASSTSVRWFTTDGRCRSWRSCTATVNRLGISRDSLSRTLEHLQTLGLAVKNPGYGHPLRPEYVLTPSGQLIGSDALTLMNALRDLDITDVALKKWSLPVTLAVHTGVERFSALLEVFPGLTSRALTISLRDLETNGLIQRRADSTYALTPNGTQVGNLLGQLDLELR
jgi:DNA-binding HxlR family transcriptional regulator